MINTVVINDNINSLEKLKEMVSQKEGLKLIANYKNPIRCLNQLKKNKKEFKLIILATNIQGYSGLEVAKHIHKLDKKIKIVFIASNQDYAVEAFKLNAFDYLVWPVEEKRFAETIKRLENH